MKLRITKLASNNQYAIEKRIFHLFKFEWWTRYSKAPISFLTLEEAQKRIEEIKRNKIIFDNMIFSEKKDKEIFRYDV